MTDSREEKWIAAAREGDHGAFEELVLLYEKRVLALTQRMCGNPEDAAEAAQEAFLAAWQGLKNFRGDSSFSTWLYRLSSNACVDLLRRELREQIEAGLRALPPEYREVLVLREMQQLRYDEIAHVLELDVGTVKSRISRGRKRLRSFLLEQGNFSPPPPSKETGKGGRS